MKATESVTGKLSMLALPISVYMCVGICVCVCGCPWRPEEGLRSYIRVLLRSKSERMGMCTHPHTERNDLLGFLSGCGLPHTGSCSVFKAGCLSSPSLKLKGGGFLDC